MSGFSSCSLLQDMESINTVILQGWVEDVPQVRYFSHELVRTSLSLRTEEVAKGSQGERLLTLWHRIVAWGEVARYLGQSIHTGDMLRLYGHLRYHRETDRNGVSKLVTEIEVSRVEVVARGEHKKLTPATEVLPERDELPWEVFAPKGDEDPMA